MKQDHRELIKAAEDAGATIEYRSKHMAVLLPNGEIVFCSVSPSDYRGLRNLAHQLGRSGLEFTWKGKHYGT